MSIVDKVILSSVSGGTAEALGGGKPCDTGRQAARRSICGGGFVNGCYLGVCDDVESYGTWNKREAKSSS